MALASNFVGALNVHIDKVTLLPEKCDPYVKIKAGTTELKTSHLNNCSNDAVYNKTLALSLDGSEDDFVIEIWDHDNWTPDDLLATSGKIPISKVIKEWCTGQAQWINLTRVKGDKNDPTKIHVTLTFKK